MCQNMSVQLIAQEAMKRPRKNPYWNAIYIVITNKLEKEGHTFVKAIYKKRLWNKLAV